MRWQSADAPSSFLPSMLLYQGYPCSSVPIQRGPSSWTGGHDGRKSYILTTPPCTCYEVAVSPAACTAGSKRPRRNHNEELDGIHATLTLLVDRDRTLQGTIATMRREKNASQGLIYIFQSIREAHEKDVKFAKGADLRDCL